MQMDYEDALLSPQIPLDSLTQGVHIPGSLFKFQSFYKEDGSENPYWVRSMSGEFHLSLGAEFEDRNDCRPFIDRGEVCSYIQGFLSSIGVGEPTITETLCQLYSSMTNAFLDSIVQNYQHSIWIGCFTDLLDNIMMWEKYANAKRGYCIEYDTSKNILFRVSTLPICYRVKPYDSSAGFARALVLESLKKDGKKRSDAEIFATFETTFEMIHKTAYIPLFIKRHGVWNFEREYRLFLLSRRTTARAGMVIAKKLLDSNANLDLSEAVKAVYLGECFEENRNHKELLEKACEIALNKKMPLFQLQNGMKIRIV